MKIKSTAAILSAAALFGACTDEVVNITDEAKEKATFTMKVVDNHSQDVLVGAEVLALADSNSQVTAESGIVEWEKNVIGNYFYAVSAEGYATRLVELTADEVGQGNAARVPDKFAIVDMYKTGVSASGTILYVDAETGSRSAASGVTVYANLGSRFVPSEVSVETDKNGEYKFENLPENVNVTIYVGQSTIKSKLYGSSTEETAYGARSTDVVNVAPITMDVVAADLFVVSNNMNKIDSATTITLTFSAALNADSLAGNWDVTKSGKKILVTTTLSSDKKTVSIKPYSGKWETGEIYHVDGHAVSKEGKSTGIDDSFKVISKTSSLPQVKNFEVGYDEDYGYIELSWTKSTADNVTGYNLYYKTNTGKDWIYYDNYSKGDTEASISERYLGSKYTSVQFILLTHDAEGNESDFAKATKVKTSVSQD